ncbi:hypothetical protein OUZ56_007167 [Daphnia magna]|uniref:Uncharacterized protein n=1 Tax=Daphnia magna TaxID=35525 RepID=A0ABQ9YZ17_9CRUS|nr:hypothetical protein OUZ56_007167 [Daphnia magna]
MKRQLKINEGLIVKTRVGRTDVTQCGTVVHQIKSNRKKETQSFDCEYRGCRLFFGSPFDGTRKPLQQPIHPSSIFDDGNSASQASAWLKMIYTERKRIKLENIRLYIRAGSRLRYIGAENSMRNRRLTIHLDGRN